MTSFPTALRVMLCALLALACLSLPASATALPTLPSDIKQVESGDGFTCALRVSGRVTCFGRNDLGQLGNGTRTATTDTQQVTGITDATAISAGWDFACAALANGSVKCWGSNKWRAVVPLADDVAFPTPVTVSGLSNIVAIDSSYQHSCAVTTGGAIRCWGYNLLYQAGTTDVLTFTPSTLNFGDAIGVAVAAGHSCALRASGTVSCWGGNNAGQLGRGFASGPISSPANVQSITDATAISSSFQHTCALLVTGRVMCWGPNEDGRLGTGNTVLQTSPTAVKDLTDAVAIGAGFSHSCALRSSGTVSCWGTKGLGQLGDGSPTGLTTRSLVPVDANVTVNASASALSVGVHTTCVTESVTSSVLTCWGAGVPIGSPRAFQATSVPTVITETPRTSDDVPTDGSLGPVTVTLTAVEVTGVGIQETTYEIIRADGSFGPTQTYDAASKPVLTRGQAIRYRSVSTTGVQEPDRTSAALGRGPQATVAPDTLDFGTVTVGEPSLGEIYSYSLGDAPMPSISTSLDTSTIDVDLGGLPASMEANTLFEGTLKVTPRVVGPIDATLTFVDDSLVPQKIRITGTARAAPYRTPGTGAYASGSAFTRISDLEFPAPISQVATSYLDDDGDLDLVAGSAQTGEIWFLIAGRPGEFGAPQQLTGTPGPGEMGLAIADLDNDGTQDITTGSRVFFATAPGTFAAGVDTGLQGTDVAVGDLNADGDTDLVVQTATGVSVAENDGTGQFGAPAAYPTASPSSILVRDVDEDGDLDVAVGSASGQSVTLLRNSGSGALTTEVLGAGAPVRAVAAGQLTTDLRLDLTTGGRVLPGRADHAFGAAVAGGTAGEALDTGDFDGDGIDDQVTADHTSSTVGLRIGRGDGTFAPIEQYATLASGGTVDADLAVSDFDEDRRMDVVVANGATTVSLLRNTRAAPEDGRDRALITEVRFGDDAYAMLTNIHRTQRLRIDRWAFSFNGGRFTFVPAGSLLAPGASLLIHSPANAGWSLGSVARSALQLPADTTEVTVDDASESQVDRVTRDEMAPGAFTGQGAFVRRRQAGAFLDSGLSNTDAFLPLDTRAAPGSGTMLGAPRPDDQFAPTNRNDILQSSLLDPSQPQGSAPNRIIEGGFLTINRTITNCSGGIDVGVCVNADKSAPAAKVTKLRFRVAALTTVGGTTVPGAAALKILPSDDTTAGTVMVRGLPLDAPSPASGGGLNATLTATQLLPADGLDPGESVNVSFRLAIVRRGAFTFSYETEDDLVALPRPTAPAGATEQVPDAPAVSEAVRGTVPATAAVVPATPASGPAATAKPAAKKMQARCVTRAQLKKLKGKARKTAKLCATKKTTTTTAKKKAGR